VIADASHAALCRLCAERGDGSRHHSHIMWRAEHTPRNAQSHHVLQTVTAECRHVCSGSCRSVHREGHTNTHTNTHTHMHVQAAQAGAHAMRVLHQTACRSPSLPDWWCVHDIHRRGGAHTLLPPFAAPPQKRWSAHAAATLCSATTATQRCAVLVASGCGWCLILVL
jgi:hypothetical protein